MAALLILHAEQLGYRVRFGEAHRLPEATWGHPQSLHHDRLAIDFMLDKRDASGRWRWQTSTKAHEELGLYWESIGGTWGGRFDDGNHYSLAHGGRK